MLISGQFCISLMAEVRVGEADPRSVPKGNFSPELRNMVLHLFRFLEDCCQAVGEFSVAVKLKTGHFLIEPYGGYNRL